jgi:hypothetical protein
MMDGFWIEVGLQIKIEESAIDRDWQIHFLGAQVSRDTRQTPKDSQQWEQKRSQIIERDLGNNKRLEDERTRR